MDFNSDPKSRNTSIVGEAILTASLDFLFKKLASNELLQFARQAKVHTDLKKWERILLKIQAVLEDAEEKQRTKESVKIWLDELRNLAYDMEDILDEFAIEALQRKLLLQPEPDQASTSMVRKLIPTCCTTLSPRSLKFNSMMRSKIMEITVRLQDISTEKNNLDLKENSEGRSHKLRETFPTTSLVNEASVYGREKDKEVIIELLLRDGEGVDVLPILGMGGLGKTTLAQLVYNDARVQGHFDVKIWACVSDNFDVVKITKTILRSVSNETIDDCDLNLLQVKLKEKLIQKKFLLVLDDVWNENYDVWILLRHPFEAGRVGSKILVTTRNGGVSSIMGTLPTYTLKKLSSKDCVHVFTQHSLGTNDLTEHQELEEIGEQIVKRCNGLPLVAKSLGGLLRGKYNPNDWEDVLNSKIWDIPEERSGILPALRLSYYYLPKHLKRCFAYCSIFPKHYAFREEEIILLWMAEGFLQHEISGKHMEDLGHKYFCDLHSKSFFQHSGLGTSQFHMHDLIHDLAQWAAGEICLRIESMPEVDQHRKLPKDLRHLSFIGKGSDGVEKFEALDDIKHLRTFLPILMKDQRNYSLTCEVLCDLLSNLQRLRVLSLRGYWISEVPKEIGGLKHLRYLNLSHTQLQTLPQSVSCLYNLQTLILKRCYSLKKLCADIGNLINLRHLNISHAKSLGEMPLRFGKLICLQKLSDFVLGKGVGSGIGEIKSLIHLRDTLKISRLENVNDAEDAKKANLDGKKNLNVLLLEWTNSDIGDSRNAERETHVLDMLQPHKKLEKLTISGYGGKRFPTWLGDSSFSKLVFLRFENCGRCATLPSVGQLPLLKYVFIQGMGGVKIVGSEFYGNGCSEYFPSLEILSFKDMEEWEDWISHGLGLEDKCFSQLRELSFVRCSKLLGRLPECLPSLERLVIRRCHKLMVSIPSLPADCKLEIDGSTINPGSLNSSVVLSDSSSMVSSGLFMPGSSQEVENLKIVGCKELTCLCHNGIQLQRTISSFDRLGIEHCPQLLSMVVEEGKKLQQQGMPSRLQVLQLINCESLVKLPEAVDSISSLRELRISNCPKLVSFPEVGFPSQLRCIEIEMCNALTSLPEAWMNNNNTSLESLSIRSCNGLLHIAKIQLPMNLKQLKIVTCNSLWTLIEEEEVPILHEENINSSSSGKTSLLRHLHIEGCPPLTSLWSKSELPSTLQHISVSSCPNLASLSSRGNLPQSLKCLLIAYCTKLESIAETLQNNTYLESIRIWHCENLKNLPHDLHKLCNLSNISIGYCPRLVSFPEGGLLSSKLTEIFIKWCEKLVALPNGMHSLSSLQNLRLESCPGIVSFPDDGFPTNLASLEIGDLQLCKPLFAWGLHRLTSLTRLTINGRFSDVVSFPQVPTSLNMLTIKLFPDLECISSIGQNLTSLELLDLSGCPKLTSFPENGLPGSLLKLYICECPLLEQKCLGQYWHVIAHIPWISINGKELLSPPP